MIWALQRRYYNNFLKASRNKIKRTLLLNIYMSIKKNRRDKRPEINNVTLMKNVSQKNHYYEHLEKPKLYKPGQIQICTKCDTLFKTAKYDMEKQKYSPRLLLTSKSTLPTGSYFTRQVTMAGNTPQTSTCISTSIS